MPKTLYGHSSFTLGNELIVLGGKLDLNTFSSSVYKMSCRNGEFSTWTEMDIQLKTPRGYFVASFIPNNLID